MNETLKERKDLDPQYMWDLSSLYKSDEEWEKTLPEIKADIQKLAAYQGKLKDAKTIDRKSVV